jgi:hypothetical protein
MSAGPVGISNSGCLWTDLTSTSGGGIAPLFVNNAGNLDIPTTDIESQWRPLDVEDMEFDDYWFTSCGTPDGGGTYHDYDNNCTIPYVVVTGLVSGSNVHVAVMTQLEGISGINGISAFPANYRRPGSVCDTDAVFDKMIDKVGSFAEGSIKAIMGEPLGLVEDALGAFGGLFKGVLGGSMQKSRGAAISASTRKKLASHIAFQPCTYQMSKDPKKMGPILNTSKMDKAKFIAQRRDILATVKLPVGSTGAFLAVEPG